MKQTYIILLLILSPLGSYADTNLKNTDIDKIVLDEIIRQNLPGLSIGVYKKGVINYTKGYGSINNHQITNNTVFRWASISKTITAVSAFQVANKYADFSINDKVTKHYPHWTANYQRGNNDFNITQEINDKKRKEKITIRHLLTHQSGIKHYPNGINSLKYKSDADNFNGNSSVDVFRNFPLDFNPGKPPPYPYDPYTTFGYNLLGAVIDKKTGSYTKWVNKNIKNKLGMSSLKVATSKFTGYKKNKNGYLELIESGSKEWVLPGGGWESNVKDLLKFSIAIGNGTLLPNTDHLWKNKYKGLRSTGNMDELRVWHGGFHYSMRTLMYVMPKKGIAVVVMVPLGDADCWNIVRRIVNKLGVEESYSTVPENSVEACKCNLPYENDKNMSYSGIWTKKNNNVLIRRGYTTRNFNKEWKQLTSSGYHLEDIEYSDNLWHGIFKKGRGKYAMWRNFTQSGFNKKWKQMSRSGYRLYDLETYTVRGKRKWAGLFKKGTGKYALYRNYSTSGFAIKRKKMAKDGLKLIDIEVYASGNSLKWSGVWIEGVDGLLNRNYNYRDFDTLVKKRRRNGYTLIDVESYRINGRKKWAGIWEKNNNMQKTVFTSNYCKLMCEHGKNNANNYELIGLESF